MMRTTSPHSIGKLALAGFLAIASAGCQQLANPTAWPMIKVGGGDELSEFASGQVPTPVPGSQEAAGVPTPTSAQSTAANRLRPVIVRRGSATETLPLVGQVASDTEAQLSFPMAGLVESVRVRTGQTVEAGQLLVEADSQALRREMDALNTRIETSRARLSQIQSTTESRDRQRSQDDAARRRKAVSDAEAVVQRAQTELSRAQSSGPAPEERRAAEQAVSTAKADLAKAQAEKDKVEAGADALALRSAERDVIRLQAEFERARAELQRASIPDPEAVKAAQVAVARAQENLKLAQAQAQQAAQAQPAPKPQTPAQPATKPGGPTPAANPTPAVNPAPVANPAVAQSAAAVLQAQRAVEDAEEKLRLVQVPPRAADLVVVQNQVKIVELDLRTAQEKYDLLKRGASPEERAAADAKVEAAQQAVDDAQGNLNRVLTTPAQAVVRAAQSRVEDAQANLEKVKADVAAAERAQTGTDVSQADLDLLQYGIDQDQERLSDLKRQVEASKLVAPFSGSIADVGVRAGDKFTSATNVVKIAANGAPMLRVVLTDTDGPRVQVGQKGTVQPEGAGATSAPVPAEVISVGSDAATGLGRIAQIKVAWPSPQVIPQFGTPVNATLMLAQKENVLLVPKKAVSTAGGKSYVEVVEGNSRRTVAVEPGLQTGADVEIKSGLREGQAVYVKP